MELKNYSQLEEHLLATMDSFTDQMCKGNPSISKENFWNICMSACQEHKNKQDRVNDMMAKNVLREFPEYAREDYEASPYTEEDMAGDLW